MIKAPRGHTSVYLSDYLKSNITMIHEVMRERGFTSFNGFINYILSEAVNNHHSTTTKPMPDVINDNVSVFTDKLSQFTDGELFDIFKQIDEKRELIYKHLKKRGVGV